MRRRWVRIALIALSALVLGGGLLYAGIRIGTGSGHPAAQGHHSASRPVACNLGSGVTASTCPHGVKLGQACTFDGSRGIVVADTATRLVCDTDGPISPPVAQATPTVPASPGQPSPVGSATLTSTCTPGLEDTATNALFIPLTSNQTIPQGDSAEDAYQLTLTNTSQATADVGGFVVILYGSGGNELQSSQPTIQETFLTPGQSLTWTELVGSQWAPGTNSPDPGPWGAGDVGAVDAGSTCSMLQWEVGSSG